MHSGKGKLVSVVAVLQLLAYKGQVAQHRGTDLLKSKERLNKAPCLLPGEINPRRSSALQPAVILCLVPQRISNLEEENALLKQEKEELNRRILCQSEGRKNGL